MCLDIVLFRFILSGVFWPHGSRCPFLSSGSGSSQPLLLLIYFLFFSLSVLLLEFLWCECCFFSLCPIFHTDSSFFFIPFLLLLLWVFANVLSSWSLILSFAWLTTFKILYWLLQFSYCIFQLSYFSGFLFVFHGSYILIKFSLCSCIVFLLLLFFL